VRRVFHPWWEWECYKAGFYASSVDGIDPDEAKRMYAEFLADIPRFERAMQRVIDEWPHSCEQFLLNENINRVAWLGQSSMCIETGVPSCYRGGFKLLSNQQRARANAAAQRVLDAWLMARAGTELERGLF
jgi:hypothetical protein